MRAQWHKRRALIIAISNYDTPCFQHLPNPIAHPAKLSTLFTHMQCVAAMTRRAFNREGGGSQGEGGGSQGELGEGPGVVDLQRCCGFPEQSFVG